MPDDIDVQVTDNTESQPEDKTPVSFIESDGDTHVVVGEEKKNGGDSRDETERWRAAETEALRLRADFADLRSRLAGNGGGANQGAPAPDPYKAAEDAIADRERALGIQWEAHKAARNLTPELLKQFDNESRALQQERINIATQRAIQGALPTILQASQREQYAAQYGDVQSNPSANRWARGYYDQLVAQGEPDSPVTVAKAMAAARRQFRIGNYRMEPTDHDRQQLSGISGNGRMNSGPKSNTVKMGKAEKNMAMAMYGDRFNGDEKKAYAQWAKGPGIRAQKAAQKARRNQAF